MKTPDAIAGLSTLLITFLAWTQARGIPFQNLEGGLGPAFFPYVLLAVLAILGIISMFIAFYSNARASKEKNTKRYHVLSFSIFCLLIAYGILFERIGFLVSTFLFLIGAMIVLKTRWWQSLGLALLLTFGIYGIFIVCFKVPLP